VTESPGCIVEEAVNAQLGKSFDEAEALLLARFSEVTLAMLATDVRRRLKDSKAMRVEAPQTGPASASQLPARAPTS
jgi:hypothetical protein